MVVDAKMQRKRQADCRQQLGPGAEREKMVDVRGPVVEFWCWWGWPAGQHACGRLCHG